MENNWSKVWGRIFSYILWVFNVQVCAMRKMAIRSKINVAAKRPFQKKITLRTHISFYRKLKRTQAKFYRCYELKTNNLKNMRNCSTVEMKKIYMANILTTVERRDIDMK